MKFKRIICADIETDGIDPTKVWVMSCTELDISNMSKMRSWSINDYDEIRDLIKEEDIGWVIHNGIGYDKPVLEKLIGEFNGEIIDSLGLSWYLEPTRNRHGLASWGEDLGIPKPIIDDWENLDLEKYIERCEEDVKIQYKLWRKLWKNLNLLYKDTELIWGCINTINNKLIAVNIASQSKFKLDVKESHRLINKFLSLEEEAKKSLSNTMPQVGKYVWKNPPKKPYKMDGSLSSSGIKWKDLCESNGYTIEHDEKIKQRVAWVDPNPGSHAQIKDWLYSLGWKPKIFKFEKNKETKEIKKIPQIHDTNNNDLCPDIIRLIKKHPELNYLKDFSIILHRKSVVNGLLKGADNEGFIVAGCQGFTNTLRLRHKCFLNIPSVRKLFGEEIRALLITRSDTKELLGADMSSLEDRIKMNYIIKFDPDYVDKMRKDNYDPHTTMAIAANLLTLEEEQHYKDKDVSKKELERLSNIRYIGKQANYACVYGAGAETIARSSGVSSGDAEVLRQAYWKLNWAVKAVSDECIVKESRKLKWIWNPTSNMWYYLKVDKDRFSTLAQGTASYVFDLWVSYILEARPQINAQTHDEIILEVKKGDKYRKRVSKLLKDSIDRVNKECMFKVPLGVDIQWGNKYSEIH